MPQSAEGEIATQFNLAEAALSRQRLLALVAKKGRLSTCLFLSQLTCFTSVAQIILLPAAPRRTASHPLSFTCIKTLCLRLVLASISADRTSPAFATAFAADVEDNVPGLKAVLCSTILPDRLK